MIKVKKILLFIDDEPIILKSLKSQLKSEFGDGFKLEFAESGEEGLEILEEYSQMEANTIILVMSDWLMPGLKGDEFLEKVHKTYPNVATVMLTGQADSEAIQRAYDQAGLFKCINKPWSKKELLSTINQVLKD